MNKESSFNKEALGEKIAMYANKIATNRFIATIRDAFASTIPITIVAAFFLLVNNVLLAEKTGLLRNMPGHEMIAEIGVQAYNGTLGILGLMVTFLIGFRLAKSYGSDGALEAIIALACYVVLVPNSINITGFDGTEIQTSGTLTQTYTSASAMLLGIIAAIISVPLVVKLSTNNKLKIKMPDSVPPAIAKSFNSLIPAFFTITLFAIFEVVVRTFSGHTIPDVVVTILQAPLVGGFQTLPGILAYVFLSTFVFIFGIHGAFVFGAISGPILLTSLQQNIEAIQAGSAAPNIVTQPFLDAYVYMGGGGTMICLVIAVLIWSKRDDQRMIAKLGGVSSLFNISEPMMFGLPIVFNPVYAIPFCIVPMVSTILAYTATSLNLVTPTYILVPWVTPPILSGYLATAGDFRAVLLQIVIIVIGTLIYMPFVLFSNKVKE
ncbi:PTS system, lactose/cellobiose family IIC component [Enterococcus moraviensis ATCC BAA-383]|uniref:Permease IIC component n=1 Tax=Enterococcus moraviensis ATCC BAA-383 TaxID=1158609 RepID=R2TSB1_9ENTE|nr:PTS sugar transporter subunit IIC [Enterococcus moraviensis]EOI03102.1 PTS system, lactose/cellobiose family IIC component [Enterococcus moraviensis ATCC BAA-383]EOT74021.1 PTS system, cellobiose-specific IIC component [Enterococcus moraviensis ATCC BAA-383]OJG67288.1 PTS system, lactose/cellobiose family IIC component [Enterococcus moraviensis]